jgi:hypothetical protein
MTVPLALAAVVVLPPEPLLLLLQAAAKSAAANGAATRKALMGTEWVTINVSYHCGPRGS